MHSSEYNAICIVLTLRLMLSCDKFYPPFILHQHKCQQRKKYNDSLPYIICPVLQSFVT